MQSKVYGGVFLQKTLLAVNYFPKKLRYRYSTEF